jgi:hypothetical protein
MTFSRKAAWDFVLLSQSESANPQEIWWVLKDTTGIDLPAPAGKTIDLEGKHKKST